MRSVELLVNQPPQPSELGALEKAVPYRSPMYPIIRNVSAYQAVSMALTLANSTFSTSVTVPATNSIAEYFSVSRTASILTLTLYTLGIAFGPMLIAPLSELVGRRWIYITTITFFLAFAGGSGGAQNFGTLLVCRCLTGLLGSAGIAIGAGTVADIWPLGKEGGIAGLFFILGPFLGPTLGPLAGAYILRDHDNNWRWTQWLLVMMGAPIWVGSILMRETSKRLIQQSLESKEARKVSRTVPLWTSVGRTLRIAILRPVRMLLTDIIVFSLTLYSAFTYAMIFSYFGSSSYILQLYYGFDEQQVGLSFLSVIIGYLLAAFIFGLFDKTLYARACHKAPKGIAAPEHRLYAGMVGSIVLPIGLFWCVNLIEWVELHADELKVCLGSTSRRTLGGFGG